MIHPRGPENHQVAGGALCVIGLVALWASFAYPRGDASEPGPAYFPIILSGAITLLGAALALFEGPSARFDVRAFWERGRALAIPLALAAAALAIERLGFRLTIAALLVFLLGVVERRPWPAVAAIAIAFPMAAFAVLHTLLRVPLPLGPFGF